MAVPKLRASKGSRSSGNDPARRRRTRPWSPRFRNSLHAGQPAAGTADCLKLIEQEVSGKSGSLGPRLSSRQDGEHVQFISR